MKIALIVEGKTEKAFLPSLRKYLGNSLAGKMPTIKEVIEDGRIPKEEKLKRTVENLLSGAAPYDAVIALTDVYTSKDPGKRDFIDAADAKRKMREWVGDNPKFFLMPRNTTLKHGFCRIGKLFKSYPGTTKMLRAENQRISITTNLRHIISKKFLVSARSGTTTSHAMQARFWRRTILALLLNNVQS